MSSAPKAQLLSAANANGSWVEWRGGRGVFVAFGTWNGATASLDMAADNDRSVAIQCKTIANAAATLSADGMHVIQLPAGLYRVSFSGSPTSITAFLSSGIKASL
jgi:hypothetical protein